MKPRTIHAIVKYFYPVAAGIETNMLETYSVLVRKGWKVTVHTSKDTLTEMNVLADREELRGISIQRYEYKPWGFIPDIDWNKADVVCLHNFNVFPHVIIMVYTFIRRIIGKNSVILTITPHGGFTPDWYIFSPFAALIKKIYHATLGTFLMNISIDGIRAVSEWEKKEIAARGVRENLIEVISNGIEDEAYQDVDAKASTDIKKRVESYGTYLIQIGRVYGIKNYETTIKALTKLPKHLNFVILGPIGSNEYLQTLKELISELKLDGRVFFAGVVRGIDKYYLIRHSLMMVHMARWESFCNAVHEGMSQGKVCIVAKNTALTYLVKDGVNGYLVETNDSKGLAEKILYVTKNLKSKEIQKITQTAKSFALENSWEKTAVRVGEWTNRLIKRATV